MISIEKNQGQVAAKLPQLPAERSELNESQLDS